MVWRRVLVPASFIGDAVLERRVEILEGNETRWRLEQAVSRSRAQ